MRPATLNRTLATLAGLAFLVVSGAARAAIQATSPADLARGISGTWKINLELSPALRSPAGRGGQGSRPSFAIGGMAGQRGRGSGGGSQGGGADLTPEQAAAQAAMRQLQQVAPAITITATADAVTFLDGRGERSFKIDGKKTSINISGAPVNARTRWDKALLRQEFEVPQSRLIQTWEVDGNDRLVLKTRVESLTMMSAEAKAVYDRQP